MLKYSHRFVVENPLKDVVALHGDSRVLKQLTPPGMFTEFHQVEPIAENSKIDFTMWLGPLPVRWVSVHSSVGLNGFTDTQIHGPFKYWQHRHSFVSLDSQSTEIIDEIIAFHGSHLFWGLVSRFMWLNMPVLFGYRGWKTRQLLKKKNV